MSVQETLPQDDKYKVIEVKEENGSLWLKTFLMDTSWNLMKWRADDELIEKRVQEFIGKPAVLTPDKQHPPYDDVLFHRPDTYENLLKSQEKFKIGTIQKVDSKPNDVKNAALGKTWYAYIEIKDPKVIESYRKGEIPQFISPSVYDPYNLPNYSSLIDFRANHIAFTDKPAYGEKAVVRGACNGSGPKCSAELKEAYDSSQNQLSKVKQDSLSTILDQDTQKKPVEAQTEEDQGETTTVEAVEEVKSKVKKAKQVLDEATGESNANTNEPSITAPLDPTKVEPKAAEAQPAQNGVTIEDLAARLAKFEEWQRVQTEKEVKNAAEQQRQLIDSSISSLGIEDEAKKQEAVDFLVSLGIDDENLKRLFGLIKALKGDTAVAPQPTQVPPMIKQASVNHLFYKNPSPQQTPKNKNDDLKYFLKGFFE